MLFGLRPHCDMFQVPPWLPIALKRHRIIVLARLAGNIFFGFLGQKACLNALAKRQLLHLAAALAWLGAFGLMFQNDVEELLHIAFKPCIIHPRVVLLSIQVPVPGRERRNKISTIVRR